MSPPIRIALLSAACAWPALAQSLSLDELMARLAAAPQRRAGFVEEKHFAALDQPLRSMGTLAYARPAHLEKITTSPNAERLVVDGDRLTITAGDDPPRVVDLGGQPAALALIDTIRGALSGDLPLLRRSYDVSASGTPGSWQLLLRPRDPAVARLVREVHIAGTGADVRSIDTQQADGDTDQLTISPL